MRIDFQGIETKWKSAWEKTGVYRVSHEDARPKYYVLDMFPYPSGSGLHVGHPLGYIASDIISRYKRMSGFNVLHPMGFDAFGLPAEQYAIQTNVHPAISTENNIRHYKEQLSNIGFSYDWSREVRTCDPGFYKWTQWIFLQLFEHYYDLDQNKAIPLSVLIAHFEVSGTTGISAATSQENLFSAEAWRSISPKEKDDILMNYRLAYRKISYVNWCEALGTVLANDEVKEGFSERGGYPVERRAMIQWSLRISAYAERLLNDLNNLDWTDSMKAMQSNWIGRSEGAQLDFSVNGSDLAIRIFTTRPDTIYGATFMVLAPEHPLVDQITTWDQQKMIQQYKDFVKTRSERDRLAATKQMTGAFTGAYATNPFTGQHIQIWIADYVLMDYGTGAIMAVPGDDARDLAFANKFNLPVVEVIDRPAGGEIGDKSGKMINSGSLNGLNVPEAIPKILNEIEQRKLGTRLVQYKMRDAIYSRQRYWGEPIPIEYDTDGVAHAIDINDLPLILPDLDDFKPGGNASPLARLTEWVNTPGGQRRDTDTMPGYAGSSWYFLRYMDPWNNDRFAGEEEVNYWRDVDLYIGGTEHAVGHLMYARFWHKFLHDKGLVPTAEPFRRLVNQGMIQGVIEYVFMYKERTSGHPKFLCAKLVMTKSDDQLVRIAIPVTFVENYGSQDSYLTTAGIEKLIAWRPEYAHAFFECSQGTYHLGKMIEGEATDFKLYTQSEIGKMGKRFHNVVDPNDIVAQHGADCFRMYEMFLGPLEQAKPWDTRNIDGVSRFLKKFWSLFHDEDDKFEITDAAPTREELRILHQTIKRVRDDIERFSLNTCISHFMMATNDLKKLNCQKRMILEPLVLLIAPFAPFISEELWEEFGHPSSVHLEFYPEYDASLAAEDVILYPVCINGKKRAEASFDVNADHKHMESEVLKMDTMQKWLDGQTIKKIVIVPGRMINIVI
ncbi:MAG TPA: class I tRNA ligase family protein [Saprospiraceae bacterium]|nr:class I tRNA ligase family protein [Saprospiraceae bacterium]